MERREVSGVDEEKEVGTEKEFAVEDSCDIAELRELELSELVAEAVVNPVSVAEREKDDDVGVALPVEVGLAVELEDVLGMEEVEVDTTDVDAPDDAVVDVMMEMVTTALLTLPGVLLRSAVEVALEEETEEVAGLEADIIEVVDDDAEVEDKTEEGLVAKEDPVVTVLRAELDVDARDKDNGILTEDRILSVDESNVERAVVLEDGVEVVDVTAVDLVVELPVEMTVLVVELCVLDVLEALDRTPT